MSLEEIEVAIFLKPSPHYIILSNGIFCCVLCWTHLHILNVIILGGAVSFVECASFTILGVAQTTRLFCIVFPDFFLGCHGKEAPLLPLF